VSGRRLVLPDVCESRGVGERKRWWARLLGILPLAVGLGYFVTPR